MKALSEIEIKYYEKDVIKVRYIAPVTVSALVHYELMNSHYVKLSFHSAKAIDFRIGDFIELPNWGRFEIIEPVKPQYDGAEYTYEPQFEAYYRKWKNKRVRYIPESGFPEAYFTLTASILVHARIILRNLAYLASKDKSYLFNRNYTPTDKDTIGDNNAVYGKTDFTISVDSTVDVKKARNISYQNINILDAVTQIASTFECEWWITENVIHFGECKLEQKADIELKTGTNVASISSSPSTSNYFTRLLSFGAARNLPDTYKKDGTTDVTKDGVVEQRLMLPTVDELAEYAATSDTAKAVVDKVNKELSDNGFELVGNYLQVKGLSEQQYIEGAITNDDDYPKNIIEIGKVETYTKEVKNNATADENDTITRTFYRLSGLKLVNEDGVQIGEPEFLDKYILKGKDLAILFQSGSLNGLDFTCKFNPLGKPLYKMNSNGAFVDKDGNETTDKSKYVVNPDSQCFEVCANENYGRFLPDPDLCPKVGDTFVLYNWDATMMSGNLIMEASIDLLLDTIEYLKKSMIDPTTYTATMLSEYVFKSKRYFSLGEAVKLNNPAFFTTPRDSRVIGYEIKLDIPWDGPQYIIGEKPSYSKIGDLAQQVSELTYNGKNYSGSGIGGTSVYIVTSDDNTPFSDTNTLSSLRAQKEFLSKTHDDETAHKLTMGEAEVTGKAKVGGKTSMVGGATVGDGTYGIDKDGIATLAGEVAEYLKSKDFNTDNPRFGSGLGMLMKDGVSYGYIDYLTVRTKMTVEQLEVRVLSRVAGDYAFTKAGSHIVYVEVKADRYRCYYTQDDGTTQTINNWQVGDFAKCKTSNIKAGKSGYTATRYYNRLVIAVSSEPVTVDGLDATKKYGYIDLAIDDSNTIEYPYTDSDGNSQTAKLVCTNSIDGEDVPQAQDDIVQWGNAFANETQYTKGTFKARGNVLLMSVSEGGLLTYTQIDQPVDGSAMAQYMTDCILPTMVRFSSDHFIIAPYAQRDAADTVICFRDDWTDKMVCGHNDVVRHSDKLWQCIVKVGETTNDYDETYREPKLTSPIWKIYVKGIPSAGKPVLTIAESTGESMYVSDTDIVTLKVQDALAANADADITSGYGFSVSRNSGNTDADTVWNTAHASIATNTFELTADDLTLAAMTQAVTFTVTAKKGDSILTMPFVKRLTGKNDLRIEFSSNVGPFVSVSRVDLQFTGRIMFGDEDITATVLADSRNTFVWTRDSGIESEDKSWVPTILTDKDGTQHPNILCVHQYANEPTGRKDCGSQWEKRLQVKYTLTATIYTDTTYNAKTVTLAESTGIASV